MNPSPGSLGGEVGGIVELPVPFRGGRVFTVSLSCQKVTSRNNSTSQELIWQDAGRAVTAPGSGGTRVAFRFAVPATLPASSNAPGVSHQWLVRLTADLPGIDLDRSFVIPVVASAAPRSSALSVPLAPGLEPPGQIPAEIVRIERQTDHLFLHYSPRRNLKSGLVTAFMGGWFLFFIADISLDYFRSAGWSGVVAEIAGRNPVKFSDIRDINGLKVHRVGYEIAGFYREDAYFETGNKLIELYFYMPNDANSAERISQMRSLIEANLRRL